MIEPRGTAAQREAKKAAALVSPQRRRNDVKTYDDPKHMIAAFRERYEVLMRRTSTYAAPLITTSAANFPANFCESSVSTQLACLQEIAMHVCQQPGSSAITTQGMTKSGFLPRFSS